MEKAPRVTGRNFIVRTTQVQQPDSQGGDTERAALSLALCSQREARTLLPFRIAERITALPIGFSTIRSSRVMTIGVPRDAVFETQQLVRFYLSDELKVVPLDRGTLTRAICIAYKGDVQNLADAAQVLAAADTPVQRPPLVEQTALDLSPTAQFLENLLHYAIARDASDIHLIPTAAGTEIYLRIGGELQRSDGTVCSGALHQEFVQRIKVLAKLDIAQRYLPQDGAFTIQLVGVDTRVRANTFPTIHGEKVALRLLPCRSEQSLDTLGLPMTALGWLEELIEVGEGGVILAGPTGSGKSTTLYTIVRTLAARGSSVVTIEDPIEGVLQGVSQLNVNPVQGLTYPLAIRAVLRQDPDAIMIGELRDRESTEGALQLAMTGHVLLTTVHGGNVYEALLRLKRFGVDETSIAQAVTLILALRLISLPCACANRSAEQTTECQICRGSGTRSRQLLVEGLKLDPSLRATILQRGIPAPQELAALSGGSFISAQGTLRRLLQEGEISETHYNVLRQSLL